MFGAALKRCIISFLSEWRPLVAISQDPTQNLPFIFHSKTKIISFNSIEICTMAIQCELWLVKGLYRSRKNPLWEEKPLVNRFFSQKSKINHYKSYTALSKFNTVSSHKGFLVIFENNNGHHIFVR